ncbi:MAG: 50S ribosomal protein L29 [Candidatus Pacebacteria bacterium]|jgi:large subunit ribosomal protein L29|nr:50S ribosomal protein L29 [Candidatus Paceibacterota bacterium]
MKTADIRKKKPEDLAKTVAEIEAELRGIRFGTASGGTKNVKKARALRKDIARVKTVMNETK